MGSEVHDCARVRAQYNQSQGQHLCGRRRGAEGRARGPRAELFQDRKLAIWLSQHSGQPECKIFQQADLDCRSLSIEFRECVAREHTAFDCAQRGHVGRARRAIGGGLHKNVGLRGSTDAHRHFRSLKTSICLLLIGRSRPAEGNLKCRAEPPRDLFGSVFGVVNGINRG